MVGSRYMNERIEKIVKIFTEITKSKIDVTIMDKGDTHRATTLKKGTHGVYIFFNENVCFKVGKAGLKSKARWNSQHYCLDETTPSTLSKSIIGNRDVFKAYFTTEKHIEIDNLNKENIREWMQDNLCRVEFIIADGENKNELNLLEAISIYELNPIFEGKI